MSVKADGKPGGPRNAIQVNDAGAFAGDSGLTYTNRELTIAGDEDKTTPLLTARGGDFHASVTTDTFIPNAEVTYTAVAAGAAGNAITITYDVLGPNETLAVAVVGSTITVHLASDAFSTATSTANDVLAAINASAGALVAATPAPGNDGSGIVAASMAVQLSGGATAADVTWIDGRGVLNVKLQTGLGGNAVNIYDPAGTVVAHIDNDGGAVFSTERASFSQRAHMFVDTDETLPLVGNATFRYSVNGFGMFVIAAGGGYGVSISSPVANDIVLNISAGGGQTGDLFVAFDENFVKTVRILPNGDLQIDRPNLGLILIDRTTADRYRLFVDNGVLGIEVV